MKGILRNINNEWVVKFQQHIPHAGVSKMGTGPGANRKIYLDSNLPVHPSCESFLHKYIDGNEVEFIFKIDSILEIPNENIFENISRPYALIIDKDEDIEETWDDIIKMYSNSTNDMLTISNLKTWLENNFEIPKRKI